MSKLTDEQKSLIEKNKSLMSFYFKDKVDIIPSYLKDTFKSNLALCFCLSALKYDKDMGFKFSTYVYSSFENCFEKVNISENKKFLKNNYLDLDVIKEICDKNIIEFCDFDKDTVHYLIDSSGLKEKEKLILTFYFFDGKSERQIGEMLKISGTRVHYLLKRIKNKIKKTVEKQKLCLCDFYEK